MWYPITQHITPSWIESPGEKCNQSPFSHGAYPVQWWRDLSNIIKYRRWRVQRIDCDSECTSRPRFTTGFWNFNVGFWNFNIGFWNFTTGFETSTTGFETSTSGFETSRRNEFVEVMKSFSSMSILLNQIRILKLYTSTLLLMYN